MQELLSSLSIEQLEIQLPAVWLWRFATLALYPRFGPERREFIWDTYGGRRSLTVLFFFSCFFTLAVLLLSRLLLLMPWRRFVAGISVRLHYSNFVPPAAKLHKRGSWRRGLLVFRLSTDRTHQVGDSYLVQMERKRHFHPLVAEIQHFLVSWARICFRKTKILVESIRSFRS